MCNFFSCIAMRNGDVFCDPMSDRHEDIIKTHNISDKEDDPKYLKFARVEITPPDGDVFAHVSNWTLRIDDESITPEWWSKGYEEFCFRELELFLSRAILVGKEIDCLSDGRFWVKDSRILNVTGNTFLFLFGSSRAVLRGSSHAVLRGSSSKIDAISSDAVGILRFVDPPQIVVANNKIKIQVQK